MDNVEELRKELEDTKKQLEELRKTHQNSDDSLIQLDVNENADKNETVTEEPQVAEDDAALAPNSSKIKLKKGLWAIVIVELILCLSVSFHYMATKYDFFGKYDLSKVLFPVWFSFLLLPVIANFLNTLWIICMVLFRGLQYFGKYPNLLKLLLLLANLHLFFYAYSTFDNIGYNGAKIYPLQELTDMGEEEEPILFEIFPAFAAIPLFAKIVAMSIWGVFSLFILFASAMIYNIYLLLFVICKLRAPT